MPRRNDAPRDLLFGLLALQNGMVTRDQLVMAFTVWTAADGKPLADLLAEQGALRPEHRPILDALAEAHLKLHGGDPEKTLAALDVNRSTRESLVKLGDPAIDATLGHVPSSQGSTEDGDADRTASYAVGTATSDGQRFRVLRPHARGGLGAVFVALDEELHREVALKQILERHADDPVSRQRFLQEAEITGGLEHPGIVPVYGLGTYGDGRPYYAMRFVSGDNLKEAVDRFHADGSLKGDPGRRSLGLRKLLRRFLDVCNTIDYAHGRGVLHRDIKPGNVIVGKHGETLVIDWGLAKATGKAEPGLAEKTLVPFSASGSSETLPGSALGTPAYMSPEQARGDLNRLGPLSDVYSLGATLHYLLTGKPPVEGDDVGEVLRRVQSGEFHRPRQLDPSIDRALEAVCLKAMALRPDGRYPSCRALADDVERWMADEPVSAFREAVTTRARRWARRNRTAVSVGTVALAAGIVGLVLVLAVQTRAKAEIARALASETRANARLAAANRRVEERYALATEAIGTFHTGVSEDFLLKEPQFKALRDRLLKAAADFYGKLGALLEGETDRGSRRALAQANFKLAQLTYQVGRIDDALAAHRAVLAAREALASSPGAGVEAPADVGQSLVAIGELLHELGKTGEARAAFERARSILSEREGPGAPAASARDVRIAASNRLGWLDHTTGRHDQAIEALEQARALHGAEDPGQPLSKASRLERSYTLSALGLVLEEGRGKTAEALAAHDATLALRRKLAEEFPEDTALKASVAQSHLNRGNVLNLMGRSAEALAEFEVSKEIRLGLVRENPSVGVFRSRLVDSHRQLGRLHWNAGKMSDAEREFRAALEQAKALADDHPSVTEYRANVAYSHYDLGMLSADLGRFAEAQSHLRSALAIRRELAREAPNLLEIQSELGASVADLAWVLLKEGKDAEAEASYEEAISIFKRLVALAPRANEIRRRLAASHMAIGNWLLQTGKTRRAEAAYREGLALAESLAAGNPEIPEFRSLLAYFHYNLALLGRLTGSLAESATENRRALDLRRKLATDSAGDVDVQRTVAASLLEQGTLWRLQGRVDRAEATDREAIQLLRDLAAAHPSVVLVREFLARARIELGTLQAEAGRDADALKEFQTAIAILEAIVSAQPGNVSDRSALTSARVARGTLAASAGRRAEAASDYGAALAILEALVEAAPSQPELRDDLAACRSELAALHASQGDAPLAGKEYRAALADQEGLVARHPEILGYRRALAGTTRRLGMLLAGNGDAEHAAAAFRRALGTRESLPFRSGRDWFETACCRAGLARLAGRAGSGVSLLEASTQAEEAVRLLRRAAEMGYRSAAIYGSEEALTSLRDRADFRLLFMDLAMPAEPFTTPR
jgi:serine/threonine-protein kinase